MKGVNLKLSYQKNCKMEHIAILNKKLRLLEKIISGNKTIESRWYKFKRTPYKNIQGGEIVYFKESGEKVTVSAVVEKVLFFSDLNEDKIKKILREYGREIGVENSYVKNLIGKKYCTLMFLKDVKEINPFNINKKGYGLMSAWISVDDINKLKIKPS